MAALHQEIIHELNTDCVEFCPATEHPDWLILGSYQLNEKTGDRHGGIDLFRLHRGAASTPPHLSLAATARGLPGVFDARWQLINSGWLVSTALSDGTLRLYRAPLDLSDPPAVPAAAGPDAAPPATEGAGASGASDALEAAPQLLEVDRLKAATQMALCVDWAAVGDASSPQREQVAAVGSSGGEVTLVQAAEGGLRRLNEWRAHELEVWTVAFDKHQRHVLYSGADDCVFQGWDCRAAAPAIAWGARTRENAGSDSDSDGGGGGDLSVFRNRKAHGAGVCCVAPHPAEEHVVATGSYDERIRLWDTRKTSKPLITSQVPTGGGAWRLRWHPRDPSLILAACMYNGFAVARASASFDSVKIVESYAGHQSIAYGADWHPTLVTGCGGSGEGDGGAPSAGLAGGGGAGGGEGQAAAEAAAEGGGRVAGGSGNVVATCSFYDRRLHLWTTATQ